jgi:hypothetical protein
MEPRVGVGRVHSPNSRPIVVYVKMDAVRGLNNLVREELVASATNASELLVIVHGYAGNIRSMGPELLPGSWVLDRCQRSTKLLAKIALRLDDFDRIEINEAFAAQVLVVYAQSCAGRQG